MYLLVYCIYVFVKNGSGVNSARCCQVYDNLPDFRTFLPSYIYIYFSCAFWGILESVLRFRSSLRLLHTHTHVYRDTLQKIYMYKQQYGSFFLNLARIPWLRVFLLLIIYCIPGTWFFFFLSHNIMELNAVWEDSPSLFEFEITKRETWKFCLFLRVFFANFCSGSQFFLFSFQKSIETFLLNLVLINFQQYWFLEILILKIVFTLKKEKCCKNEFEDFILKII